MAGKIPENILEDILNRIDIVEVISSYLPLKRAGRNFKANCPFHHEKTPSFMVSADRQIYHCFGCGESGNAFKFLMRYERMEFPEAVETLARKAGVSLPESSKENTLASGLSTQLYKINELASQFFAHLLTAPEGLKARQYLLNRGIRKDTAVLLKIGLASDKWDTLMNALRAGGINLSLIEKAGLILAKDKGGYYDRFRSRIIFPVFDIKSRVLGFGARVLDETLPKYINSPETLIYTKGKNLYGLNLAKDDIRDNDLCVVVEGYLDFLMPYQEGVRNIVASLGTALTVEQARLIKRYTHNVVMVYDPDKAGELATLRSLDIFIEEEMQVKVATLPQGQDPDLFVRTQGVGRFKEIIAQALSLFDYKLKILKSRFKIQDIEGKAKISQQMLETIAKFKNAVLRWEYIKKLAEELNVREDALLEDIKKIKPGRPEGGMHHAVLKKENAFSPTEKLLIKLMFEENTLILRIKEHLQPNDFQDARISKVVSLIFGLMEQGKTVDPRLLINLCGEDDSLSQLICESIFLPESAKLEQKERMVDDCIQRMKSQRMRDKRLSLHDRIKSAQEMGDEQGVLKLVEEFHNLMKTKPMT